MSTQASSGTGIFAKLVAKFLVKWVRKTRDKNRNAPPALSATPSPITGPRVERDRSRENLGQHAGAQGVRAAQAAPQVQALAGGDFGQHQGQPAQRAVETPTPVTAVQGDDYGQHRGTGQVSSSRLAAPQPRDHTAGRPQSFGDQLRQAVRNALRELATALLRELGLSDQQQSQARSGHIPAGHQLMPAGAGRLELSQVSPESQLATNQHHLQVADLRPGESVSLAPGSRVTVLVMVVSQ